MLLIGTTFCVVSFCVICVFCLLVVLVRLSVPVHVIDWKLRLVSEMTYKVLMGTLNPTHLLTITVVITHSWVGLTYRLGRISRVHCAADIYVGHHALCSTKWTDAAHCAEQSVARPAVTALRNGQHTLCEYQALSAEH